VDEFLRRKEEAMARYLARVYWKRLGGHTHARVFVGAEEPAGTAEGFSALGRAGDLVLRNEEWEAMLAALGGDDRMAVEFREER
jgi:hypothetical protein